MMYQSSCRTFDARRRSRQHRQLAAELLEDLHEDRDEEEQHPGEDEGREDRSTIVG